LSTNDTKAFAPLVRSPTLTEDAYARIRSAIVDRTLAPGERVTESGLAHLLGVSKTPVREALVRLREVGLVRADGQRGVRVVDLSSAVIDDVYEVREALELAGIEKVVEAAQSDGLREVDEAAAESMAAAEEGDEEAFARWDAAFHLELAKLSGNEHRLKLLRDTLDLIAAIRQGLDEQLEASPDCAAAHSDIVSAVRSGDVAAVRRRLSSHIDDSRRRSRIAPPTPDP
jgi:GntR family transcriptional regulator, rspAB operon transcriptional repressor